MGSINTSETSEETSIENVQLFISTGRLVANSKPRPKLVVNLSSNYVPVNERIWIDIDTEPFDHSCFCCVKTHDQNTATRLQHSSKRRWSSTIWRPYWRIQGKSSLALCNGQLMLGQLSWQKEQERRKGFNIAWILLRPINSCLPSNSGTFRRYSRPTLQDNILLLDDFAEYIYHTRNAHDMHSMIKSGLIPEERKSLRRGRQSFLTAVIPMCARQDLEEVEFDVDKPRIAPYTYTWRAHHHTVFWCNWKIAQRKGLQF